MSPFLFCDLETVFALSPLAFAVAIPGAPLSLSISSTPSVIALSYPPPLDGFGGPLFLVSLPLICNAFFL